MLLLLLMSVHPAKAQNVSVYFGMGTARDSSSGQFGNNLGFQPGLFPSPSMGGVFGMFGGDYMWKPHLGFGAEYSFRFAQGPYEDLNYRPVFYDFNAVWRPITRSDRFVPEFQGGIGGATLKFYYPPTCLLGACQNSGYPLISSSHFQLHGSAGLRWYVKPHIFIRPQIDIHYVAGFVSNAQFGSNWVPMYTVAVGYTFGGQ